MANSEENLQKKIEASRHLLEKLAGLVPGYHGYQEKELRRDADHKNRQILYGELKQALEKLEKLCLRITEEKKLDLLADLDRTSRKLRTVADRIRLADYGYAGFFSAFKIEQKELDKLYEFDLALAQQVKMIKKKVDELAEGNNLANKLVELDLIIDGLDERFEARERAIMGVE